MVITYNTEDYGLNMAMNEDIIECIEMIYCNSDILEKVFTEGRYYDIDNGYIIALDADVPESPKLYIYEDYTGLHLVGRGNYFSESEWLDVSLSHKNYFSRDKTFRVGNNEYDGFLLSIYKTGGLLHLDIRKDMLTSPLHYITEAAY